MDQAACQGVDPELFFPERRDRKSTADKAIAICQTCPVTEDCLRYALALDRTYFWSWGIWGGTSKGDRDRMVRARNGGRRW